MSIETQTRPHHSPDANPDTGGITPQRRQRTISAITSYTRDLVSRFFMPENQDLLSPTSDIDSVEQPPEKARGELGEAEREQLIAQIDAIIQQEKDVAHRNDVDYHTARYHDAVETRSALEHGLHPDDIRIGFFRRKVATKVFELMPHNPTE